MNLLGSLIQRGILIGEKFVDYNNHTSPKRKQEIVDKQNGVRRVTKFNPETHKMEEWVEKI